jgi:hypothetical protein
MGNPCAVDARAPEEFQKNFLFSIEKSTRRMAPAASAVSPHR